VTYPGETLQVEMWDEPGAVAVRVTAKERSAVVLTHARVEHDETTGTERQR
jgi:hypothetical protein